MRTSVMAAAAAAAILSATMAMPADKNLKSQYCPQSTTVLKGHRLAVPTMKSGATTNATAEAQEQTAPIALKTTPISLETGVGVRKRAALATLLLIGAAAPCLRAEGDGFIASVGC